MLEFFHCAVAIITLICSKIRGHAVAQLIEALSYKPEGRGFDSCCVIDTSLPSLGWTQPITDMSTNAGADNLTNFVCRVSRNLGATTSWNPQGQACTGIALPCFVLRYCEISQIFSCHKEVKPKKKKICKSFCKHYVY
jgi:hypothetical protein